MQARAHGCAFGQDALMSCIGRPSKRTFAHLRGGREEAIALWRFAARLHRRRAAIRRHTLPPGARSAHHALYVKFPVNNSRRGPRSS